MSGRAARGAATERGRERARRTCTNHSTDSCSALSNGVNSKSGKYLRSFSLLAVFLYWPSALDVSHCARVAQGQLSVGEGNERDARESGRERARRTVTSPWNSTALTMASATCLIVISSFSPTDRMIGSISGYSVGRRYSISAWSGEYREKEDAPLSCQMKSLARSRE